MTTEEFWDIYLNKDILEIFDETCDFFRKKLPQEFLDNYDVGEVILETHGHQESAKNFDNVLAFTDILQNNQPQLYNTYFQYFDDFLIDYYCFQQDASMVRKASLSFIDNPLHDIDIYLLAFKKLLFYQHSKLVDEASSENFQHIEESADLIGGAEYELAMCRYYIVLQEIYERKDESLDRSAFSSKLSDYKFDFDDDFLSSIETGLLQPQLDADELGELFKKHKDSAITVIKGYFLRYMYEKGFAFYLSGRIYSNMLGYWQENNRSKKTLDSYFKVKTASFEKHLAGISSDIFLDNKSEMIAILWGSVYVFDFLHEHHLISEESFLDFLASSRILKGKIIGQFTADLWNSNFVHIWEKPDCISETEFVEESNIFNKSISFKNERFSELRSSISEELSKIGELSNFIVEGGESGPEVTDTTWLNSLFDPPDSEFESRSTTYDPSGTEKKVDRNEPTRTEKKADRYVPIRTEKKVGRNEPCPCGSGKKYKKCCGP